MRGNSHKIEDRLLLERACRKACGKSLSILYHKYRKSICDFLCKTGADVHAEDICQAVFVQILDGKCDYNGSGDVKSYLFGIARNIRNQETLYRERQGQNCSELKVVGDLVFDTHTQPCPTEALNVEIANIFEKSAEKLPSKARQAIELVYLEGIPAKKAAEIAQCDFKTFRARLSYGLQFLRESIKK